MYAVLMDAELVGNERWGVYICSLSGTGQVFMNDVSVSGNGRGGIAIVGKGSQPTFRTVCMQNTGAAFNFRFGVLLFDVARTLLYNVPDQFTFSDPDDLRFGDGIAVSASDDVFLWDATSNLNNRAGYAAFGPTASEMSHVHLVGELNASDNTIDLAIEGSAVFDPHHMETLITGLWGFPDEDAPSPRSRSALSAGLRGGGLRGDRRRARATRSPSLTRDDVCALESSRRGCPGVFAPSGVPHGIRPLANAYRSVVPLGEGGRRSAGRGLTWSLTSRPTPLVRRSTLLY